MLCTAHEPACLQHQDGVKKARGGPIHTAAGLLDLTALRHPIGDAARVCCRGPDGGISRPQSDRGASSGQRSFRHTDCTMAPDCNTLPSRWRGSNAAGTQTPAPTQFWSGPLQLPACVALINASITPVNGTFNQTKYFSQPPLVCGASQDLYKDAFCVLCSGGASSLVCTACACTVWAV